MKNGWEMKTFADVLEIRNGKNQTEVLSDDGPYPIYGSAGNLMGYATDYICEAGTTIVGRKGSINNPIYVESRFWNVDTAFGLSPKEGLDSKFLYYFCISYDFSEHNQGTTIPSLVKTDLLKIAIPVPPIEEQRRIVAILDEAFACIDKAIAHTEKNILNARELFDSYLNNIFSNPAPDWERRPIGEICALKSGTTIPKSLERQSGDIPYVKVGDMNLPNNEIEITTSSRFVNTNEISANQIIPEGSIIFPKRGGAIATNKKRAVTRPIIADLNTMAIIPGERLSPELFLSLVQAN